MLIKIGNAWVDPQEIAAFFPTADLPSTPKIGIILHSGGNVWTESTMDEAEAALIDAGYIENPYPENDTPDLTDGEVEVLLDLYHRDFEYLARDADGKLYAFRDKPEKEGAYWNSFANKAEPVDEGFDFVDYEDEKPWSIAYLLLD
jgi:hypothetical protein